MRRLLSSVITLSVLASFVPATQALSIDPSTVPVELPTSLPCAGTAGKSRARCITDALKTWKEMEHDYDQEEDDIIDRWKADHADMGIGADYQTALRTFLNGMRTQRKEFDKQLNAFRKAFFAEQKTERLKGSVPAAESSTSKDDFEAAKAKCGKEDDDGLYRTCVRQILRLKRSDVTKRSRSTTKLLGK